MDSQGQTEAKYHVLLIGIDDYKIRPLSGCVNDIDTVQRMLLGDRMGLPAGCIRRLASPRPGAQHDTALPSQPATLDNIRDALRALDSDTVGASDRVFIYYSGHGHRVAVKGDDGRTFYREALVPADFYRAPQPSAYLFDFELNELLAAVARRTSSVTVVLDCCHSAGATREGADPTEPAPRSFDDELDAIPPPDLTGLERALAGSADASGVGEGVDACHVVSACLAHEAAREGTYGGKRNGLLTHSFTAALDAATGSSLRAITWAQIWQPIRASMAKVNASQHPGMAGNEGRVVFAGPPVDRDPGIHVTPEGSERYRVEAGTMADITRGAELAIYGDIPRRFPALDSPADRDARIGLLRVYDARPATATASVVTPFVWGPGVRARLVKAGEATRLRYAVTPGHPEIQIPDSPLLERVDALPSAVVRLELNAGAWRLTDDEHTTDKDAAVLCELQSDELDLARNVLEHYHAYSLPLRMAQRATSHRKGDLQVSVLCCPDGDISPEDAQAARFQEAGPGKGRYHLSAGARVCFRVRNTGPDRLRVTLFDVAASGRVQKLGDEIIDGAADHVFWLRNTLGLPFTMSTAPGKHRGIDRLVAIGRTNGEIDLDHLEVKTRFADIVDTWRGRGTEEDKDADRDVDDEPVRTAPLDRWTGAVAVVDIGGS